MKLLPDQQEVFDELRLRYKEGHRSVLLRADTGWGKSYATSFILKQICNNRKKAWFTVATDILFEQTEIAFKQAGIKYNTIQAGKPIKQEHNITLCMIQTLKHRLPLLTPPDFVVFDECSHIVAGTWTKVFNWIFPAARVLGLTATPERLSGEGLAPYFSTMVEAKPIKWLIENKRLSQFSYFAPSTLNMSGCKSRGGEYKPEDLEDKMKSVIVGDTIEHYKKLANNKRAILFSYNIKDSQLCAEQFNAAGIPAAHIDGNTPKDERIRIVKALEDKEILVLCNVNLCIEGLSVNMVQAVIHRSRTKSRAKFMQINGRGLRYSPDKDKCIIIDMVGNVFEHGLPDTPVEWKLEGKKKRDSEATVAVRECKECFSCFAPADECPECGAPVIVEERIIKLTKGELAEIKREEKRVLRAEREAVKAEKAQRNAAAQREKWGCKSVGEMMELATRYGYDKYWGLKAWKIVQAKRSKRG